MDENLINEIIEEEIDLSESQEVVASVDAIEEESAEVSATAVEEIATVAEPDVIEITIEEGVGYTAGQSGLHSTLPDRNNPDQHVIESITGLREELNSLSTVKTPHTLYSDKTNVATYYKWESGAYDVHGYFVSVVDGDKIKICNGSDIFGVVVDSAGFVGNQTATPRDNSYGLVVTSGLVDVRCELDVDVGDYIVSNSSGYAKKSVTNYGYKVLGTAIKHGVNYAVIVLGVQADVINILGADLNVTKEQVDANYKNIISAVNVANQAYNKSTEATTVSQEALLDALKALGNSEDSAELVRDALDAAQNASSVAAQARAIANSAATSAEAMRNEAVEKANEALVETTESREYFNTLSATMSDELKDVKDQLTGLEGGINDYKEEVEDTYVSRTDFTAFQDENTLAIAAVKKEASDTYATITSVAQLKTDTSDSIAGLRTDVQKTYATQTSLAQLKTDTTNAISASENKATATYATKTDLTSFQGTTNTAMARIEQKADANGAYIQSTVANIDKYTVGPHSQAYGFNRKQAQSVLEDGMIYVPTDDNITETYDKEGDFSKYERKFSKYYLYRWGEVSDGYGWITVDADYSKDKLNTSAPSVFFSHTAAPTVAQCNTYGYWYTDGATLTGTATGYTPYTLYKWDLYATKDDDGNDTTERCWIPVATLAGNSQNRAVSQIRQDANSINLEVTNARGSAASLNARIDSAESNIQMMATWQENLSVGGRNFLLNSDSEFTVKRGSSNQTKDLQFSSKLLELHDKNFIISFDAKTEATDTTEIDFYFKTSKDGGDVITNQSGHTLTNEYVRYVVQLKLKTNYTCENIGVVRLRVLKGNAANVLFKNVKLEAGNIATDWTPSPEDVSNSIAGVKATADATRASVTTIAQNIGKDGEVNAASIVTAVNESGSSVVIDADHVNLQGYVTMTNLSTGGQTTIDGANIVTGTMRSENYDVGTAASEDTPYVPSTGYSKTGTAIDLSSGAIYAQNFGVTDDGTLYARAANIEGTLTTGKTGSYTRIQEGEVQNASMSWDSMSQNGVGYNIAKFSSGELNFSRNITQSAFADVWGRTEMAMFWDPDTRQEGNSGDYKCVFTIATPWLDINVWNGRLLGTWWAEACLATTSDATLKHDIESLSDNYSELFDGLKPVRYKYNNGTSNRFHTGFIAQDVKESIEASGLSTQDFAAIIKAGDTYSLRYEEFIPLNTWQIQKLKSRVNELEAKNAELEERLAKIESLLNTCN